LVLALVGTLGAGKTLFVKGLAEGLGVDPGLVASPTFAIVNEYPDASAPARGTRLAHVDLYRLERSGELEDVGFADLLEPDAVVAVEWADRFPEALPSDRLELELVRPSDAPEERRCRARALGSRAEAVLAQWRLALAKVSAVGMES
jgi:tRNA threonylcarbamoyladenosine biosynthesis protein TsaE